jgi:hypothetical protein
VTTCLPYSQSSLRCAVRAGMNWFTFLLDSFQKYHVLWLSPFLTGHTLAASLPCMSEGHSAQPFVFFSFLLACIFKDSFLSLKNSNAMLVTSRFYHKPGHSEP